MGGVIGPALDEVHKRKSKEELLEWIADPQRLKPGSAMPQIDMTPEQREEIVTWLLGLSNTSPRPAGQLKTHFPTGDLRMKFRSQRVAYWFFASALALLVLQIVYGFIMGFARVGLDGLHEWIPFNTARAVHTNLLVVWLLCGFMGSAYFIIPEEANRELAWPRLAYVQLISLLVVGVIAVGCYHFNIWEGRKFLEIPRPLDWLVVANVLLFIGNIGMTLWRGRQPHHHLYGIVHGAALCCPAVPAGNDLRQKPDRRLVLSLVGGTFVGRGCLGAHHGGHPVLPVDQVDRCGPGSGREVAVLDCRAHVPLGHTRGRVIITTTLEHPAIGSGWGEFSRLWNHSPFWGWRWRRSRLREREDGSTRIGSP